MAGAGPFLTDPPVQVLVLCHVESGAVRDRTIVFDRRHEEGVTDALPRILEFAAGEHVPITLALTPQAARLAPVDLAGFPHGLHLHPQDDTLAARLRGAIKLTSDCLARYSASDQSLLIRTGADAVAEATGRAPNLFVAGNWSESNDTRRILETAGFGYDGSPLPGYISPCADWGGLPRLAQPYHPSPSNYQGAGESRLLYLPVFRGFWGDYLTPENLHFLGVRYFMASLKEAATGGARVVHIYFHSPMALDPFFLAQFREVLEFARDRIGAGFVEPSAVTARATRAPRAFPPAYLAYLDSHTVKRLVVRRFPTFAPDRRRQGHESR